MARWNGSVTDGRSNAQRLTQRKREGREVEQALGDGTESGRTRSPAQHAQRSEMVRSGKNGGATAEAGKNYVRRPQQQTQPNTIGLNSRTNLSHTLRKRREATARQASII